MNETTKRILTEAGFDVDSLDRMGLTDQIEKAFHLVTKETIELIRQKVSYKYLSDTEDYGVSKDFTDGHYSASIEARAAIKRHFGYKDEN